MQKPRLKCTVEVIDTVAGDLYLLRPSLGVDYLIEDVEPPVRALLGKLDGSASAAELGVSFGAELVTEVVEQLHLFELVEDAVDDERTPAAERARFDRQLRYLSDVGSEPSSLYQARLRDSRVVVLGVGGLGGFAAYALACCGIGELVLVDGDRVELSNLNRQVLYTERDIGRPKAEVAARTLAGFNSSVRITVLDKWLDDVDSIRAAIAGSDIVVNAADWPAHDIERWVNEACVDAAIPVITMSHSPPVARVGPLYVPGKTGCFGCQEARYRREYPLYDEVVDARRGRPTQAATLGPVCGFVGGQVALEVFHHLTGLCTPATLGRARIYDLRTMEIMTEEVARDPACAVCAGYTRRSQNVKDMSTSALPG